MWNYFILFMSLLAACSGGKGSSANPGGSNPAGSPQGARDTTFTNPLLPGGPDPWVIQKGGTYYYTNTVGDHLAIWPTHAMSDLSKAAAANIWFPPATGPYSKEIWAPELHNLDGKWYMYFAADDGNNNNHRIYALENDAADPLAGNWTFRGRIADTTADRWAIDASVFEYNNHRYMVWSGWQGATNGEQDIYIAEMAGPLTLKGQRVLISAPTLPWEKKGAPPAVNEGPEALAGPTGQLFLVFSASGCWTDDYCLGLLTLRSGGNPLSPADWTKSPDPVFKSQPSNEVYAPGHNGFFVSRDGKQNWIVYHANALAGAGCGSARSPRMQPFSWNADGTPNFGIPVKSNVPMAKPSGE